MYTLDTRRISLRSNFLPCTLGSKGWKISVDSETLQKGRLDSLYVMINMASSSKITPTWRIPVTRASFTNWM